VPVATPTALTVTVYVPRVVVAEADIDSVDTADVEVDESMTTVTSRETWGPPEPDTLAVKSIVSEKPLDPVRSMLAV
jgi:hypothetical protein